MTVIAYRSGILAADSRESTEGEAGGISYTTCEKLFRKRVGRRDVLIGTAGGSYLGMVFVDWYQGRSTKFSEPPAVLRDADLAEDFEILLVEEHGVYTVNHLCRPVKIIEPFAAIGCGRKAALALMHHGASARKAVELTCRVDPLCGFPIRTMRL